MGEILLIWSEKSGRLAGNGVYLKVAGIASKFFSPENPGTLLHIGQIA